MMMTTTTTTAAAAATKQQQQHIHMVNVTLAKLADLQTYVNKTTGYVAEKQKSCRLNQIAHMGNPRKQPIWFCSGISSDHSTQLGHLCHLVLFWHII
jgi:hypothetical protein